MTRPRSTRLDARVRRVSIISPRSRTSLLDVPIDARGDRDRRSRPSPRARGDANGRARSMMMTMMTTRGRRLHHRSRVHDGRHRDLVYPLSLSRASSVRPSDARVVDGPRRRSTRCADAAPGRREGLGLGRDPARAVGRRGSGDRQGPGGGRFVSRDPRESQTHHLVQSKNTPARVPVGSNRMSGRAVGVGLARVTTHEKSPPPLSLAVPGPARARVGPGPGAAEVDGCTMNDSTARAIARARCATVMRDGPRVRTTMTTTRRARTTARYAREGDDARGRRRERGCGGSKFGVSRDG